MKEIIKKTTTKVRHGNSAVNHRPKNHSDNNISSECFQSTSNIVKYQKRINIQHFVDEDVEVEVSKICSEISPANLKHCFVDIVKMVTLAHQND